MEDSDSMGMPDEAFYLRQRANYARVAYRNEKYAPNTIVLSLTFNSELGIHQRQEPSAHRIALH